MFKKNDIISNEDYKAKVLAIIEDLVFISYSNDFEKGGRYFTQTELEKRGFKVEECFVLAIGENYCFADITVDRLYGYNFWNNDKSDKHRLKYNLIFKTKEEAITRAENIIKNITKELEKTKE